MKTLRKTISILLILTICLSFVSCSDTQELKEGKKTSVKYTDTGLTVLSFTPESDGEYTFRTESETEATCTLYSDPECTKPVSHSCTGENCALSAVLKKEEAVYLGITYSIKEEEKGYVTVSPYSDDSLTDVNYGHPAELSLGNGKSMDNTPKDSPRVFSFTSEETDSYVISCSGEDEIQIHFYTDAWCTEETEFLNDTQYPVERYKSEDMQYCMVSTIAKGETVYFTVTPSTNNSEDEVGITAVTDVPDATSAREYFTYLTEKMEYSPYLLICSSPEDSFGVTMSNYYLSTFTQAETEYTYGDKTMGNGDATADYISADELKLLADGTYDVYSIEDLQDAVDSLWGEGRVDVSGYQDTYAVSFGGNHSLLVTEEGYVFNRFTMSTDGIYAYYEITETTVTDTCTVVTAKGIVYDDINETVTDAANYLGVDTGITDMPSSGYSSLDEYLEELSLTDSDLYSLDFVFYSTKDGYRLYGVFPSGNYTDPDLQNESPFLPEVVPDTFQEEYLIQVDNEDGLRFREGPGTDYDTIFFSEDGTELRSYGETDGWLYACYMGYYGWVSAEYVSYLP